MRLEEAPAAVDVEENEYVRLLGLPRGRVLEEPLAGLARWARDWFEENGQPWVVARQTDGLELDGATVRVESRELTSPELAARLERADAGTAVVAALGAGPEAEAEAGRLWRAGEPDRYFFLETYASAVVESLMKSLAGRLCAWADEQGLAVLPPYSPGYRGWPLDDQRILFELVAKTGELPSLLEVMESGQLRPKKSQLTLFGVAPSSQETARLAELIPCTDCSYSPCRYRRAPYVPVEYDPVSGYGTRPTPSEPEAPPTETPSADQENDDTSRSTS